MLRARVSKRLASFELDVAFEPCLRVQGRALTSHLVFDELEILSRPFDGCFARHVERDARLGAAYEHDLGIGIGADR